MSKRESIRGRAMEAAYGEYLYQPRAEADAYESGFVAGAEWALAFSQEDVDAAAERLWKITQGDHGRGPSPVDRAQFNVFKAMAITVLESFGARYSDGPEGPR